MGFGGRAARAYALCPRQEAAVGAAMVLLAEPLLEGGREAREERCGAA